MTMSRPRQELLERSLTKYDSRFLGHGASKMLLIYNGQIDECDKFRYLTRNQEFMYQKQYGGDETDEDDILSVCGMFRAYSKLRSPNNESQWPKETTFENDG